MKRGIVPAACLALLTLRCAGEAPTGAGEGEVRIQYRRTPAVANADSIRVWIRDASGSILVGPIATSVRPEESEIELSLPVPSGNDRRIEVRLEGRSPAPPSEPSRGSLAEGDTRGVSVRAGTVADASVRLVSTVPGAPSYESFPGDLQYRVRWRGVAHALDYELFEWSPPFAERHRTADTTLLVDLPLGEEKAERRFRVRARTPLGSSVWSDSLLVRVSELRDQPRVLATEPNAGAIEVSDTSAVLVHFNHAMDWSTVTESSVRLIELPSATPVAMVREGVSESALRLAPLAPLRRGRAHRVEIGTAVADLEHRPVDQDPTQAGLQSFSTEFVVEVYDPLRVLEIEPTPEEIEVSSRPVIRARLNRRANASSVGASSVRLADSSGVSVPLALTLEEEGRLVVAAPPEELQFGMRYDFVITSLLTDAARGEPLDQDSGTTELESFRSRFRVESQPEGPSVVSVAPIDLETAALVYEPVRIRFSLAPDPATLSTATVNVRRLPLGANIPGSVQAGSDDREFLFVPNLLERDVRYRVVVLTGVRDPEGHPFDQDRTQAGYQEFVSSFRTEKNPQLAESVPISGAVRVPVTTDVRLRFTLPIDPASLNESSLAFEHESQPVGATRRVSTDSLEVVLAPAAPLGTYRVYTVRITPELRTRRGSRFDSDLSTIGHQAAEIRFTTRAESLPPRVLEVAPTDLASGVGARPTIEVRLSRPVQPASVNAANFLLKQLPSGSEIDGLRLLTPDSLVARFTPTADLAPLTDYEIRVTTWLVDRFDTRFDQDPVQPGRQEFASRFRTDQERVSPRVVAAIPADGAEDVAWGAEVGLTLSEPSAPGSVTDAAFRLLRDGVSIVGSIARSPDGLRLTFTPAENLRADALFTVQLDTLVTDLSGNPLDQDPATGGLQPFESAFRTVPDRVGPRVVVSAPEAEAEGVDVNVHPWFRFDEPLDPTRVTNTAFTLTDSLEQPRTLSVELDVSRRLVTLSPAESLSFHTPYRLRATSALTDTAGNPHDQDPKTSALESFELSFRTRYENIPPRVTELSFEGGPPVPVDSSIRLAFSEAIDGASLADTTLTLWLDGTSVPVLRSLIAPDTARAVPLAPLSFNQTYRVRVAGLRDLRGNPLDQDRTTPEADAFEATFLTEPDLVPPRVLAVVPDSGALRVHPEVAIEVVFSEPIDAASANSANLVLTRLPGGQVQEGTVTTDVTRTRLFHRPTGPLAEGAEFEIRASYLLRDDGGNGLDQDPETPEAEEFTATFRTGLYPVAAAGPGICDPADSSAVTVDASGSLDPDGGGLQRVVWEWGDGSVDTLATPAGLVATHVYSCLDLAGCDLVDNDGDGTTDETGAEGCDESRRIVIRVEDVDGQWDVDSTGVSFCAFQSTAITPRADSTDVDTLLTAVRVRFSRPVASATYSSHLYVRPAGGSPLALGYALEEGGRVVVLELPGTLDAATEYEVGVDVGLTDEAGRPFDQQPCAPGRQGFSSRFTTESRPEDQTPQEAPPRRR